jgi:hypothetical protein
MGQAIGFGFLKGCTSTAFTGHDTSQLKQVQQSSGYLISAFPCSLISMTSPGQKRAQLPHPTHTFASILRIIVFPPFAASGKPAGLPAFFQVFMVKGV